MVSKRSCLIWDIELIHNGFFRSDRALSDTIRTVIPATSFPKNTILFDQSHELILTCRRYKIGKLTMQLLLNIVNSSNVHSTWNGTYCPISFGGRIRLCGSEIIGKKMISWPRIVGPGKKAQWACRRTSKDSASRSLKWVRSTWGVGKDSCERLDSLSWRNLFPMYTFAVRPSLSAYAVTYGYGMEESGSFSKS